MEEKKEEVTGTLRKDKTLLRDEKKMEKLKQKLHTDDEREQGAGGGGRGSPSALLSEFSFARHCLHPGAASVLKPSPALMERNVSVGEGGT